MMPGSEYIEAKHRMLLVAEVIDRMMRQPDTLKFSEAMVESVMRATAWNRADVCAVFAEMDMLRAALGLPIVPEGVVDAASGATVAPVPEVADAVGRGEDRPDAGGTGDPVPDGGVNGQRTKRPKPRRNKKSNAGTTE
jgi:hypothetical protein